jgi:hypothetical protein
MKLAELTRTTALRPVKSLDSVFDVSPPLFSMTELSKLEPLRLVEAEDS